MANRFPLTLDGTAIKEIPSGDNLDLTGSGITGAGTVALTNLTVGGSQGTDGQVLTSTGSGIAWEDAASGGGGALNLISSQTISSAVSSLTFTGMTGYKVYKVIWSGIGHSGNPYDVHFRASTDGGSTFWSATSGTGFKSSIISSRSSVESFVWNNSWMNSSSKSTINGQTLNLSGTNQRHSGELTLYNWNESAHTQFHARDIHETSSTNSGASEVNGVLQQTVGFNAIKFVSGGGVNFTTGTYALYGLSTS